MDLSVIVVSWNVRDKLRECLKALFDTPPLTPPLIRGGKETKFRGEDEMEVFVIDNHSSDGSAQMVEKEFGQVKLIKNKKNLGLAKAVNQVRHRLKGDFILLLNPDNIVFGDTLDKMLKWMKANPQASVAGCRLVDERGETIKHVRRFPTVWDQLAIILKLPHLFPWILNKYIIKDFDYSQAQKADSIRGSFFMIRNEMAEKIGLWDQRYFIWFEEVDYCRQVKEEDTRFRPEHFGTTARQGVWYTPAAKCLDYVGQSFAKTSGLKKQKYFRDSMLKYFKKWHPAWQYWLLRLAWPIGIFMAWAGERIGYRGKSES